MLPTGEFLDVVWGKTEGYVDVPSKMRGHWMPFMARWPQDRAVILRRIRDCVADGEDVYFSAALFEEQRRIEEALPTHWLWSDLDLEDPVGLEIDALLPTLAWESSPGRYQAMWRLDREVEPRIQTKLCRRLTRAVDADRGGYDLTQVLRPPGTVNYKYDPPAEIEVLWYLPDLVYTPRGILRAIEAVEGEVEDTVVEGRAVTVGRLSARTRRLLTTPAAMVVAGERSARLWELECLLAEQGLEEDQIVELVRGCAWNKWKGMGSEERQLLQDARKAIRHVAKRAKERVRKDAPEDGTGQGAVGEDKERASSPFIRYGNFLSGRLPTPRWLIQDIWGADSHGFVGGEPKVSKSTFVMAMGMAVASGGAFLGRYKVPSAGPVLLIQEENAPWMVQDRLRKLANHMGLLEGGVKPAGPGRYRVAVPQDHPLFILNNWGFNLMEEEDRHLLEDEIREKEAKFIILDPLYLMVGSTNLNNQHEVGPVLHWLTALRYKYNCAIAIVHHWAKVNENTNQRRPGQRLLGTAIQHGWVESGIYLGSEGYDEAKGEFKVVVEREFRNSPPRNPLSIVWKMGKPGKLDFDVQVYDYNAEGQLEEMLVSMGLDTEGKVLLTSLAGAMQMEKPMARKLVYDSTGFETITEKRGRVEVLWVRRNGTHNGS